jgi:hypothetical protein
VRPKPVWTLIGNQQGAILVGGLANARQKSSGDNRSRFALDRLHEHSGDIDAHFLADVNWRSTASASPKET